MAAQSLGSASAAARNAALSQLDSLGSNRSDFSTEEVFTAMESDVADFISRVHDNINAAGIVNTGEIADIKMVVSDTGIQIQGKNYLVFQDRGVSGVEKSQPDTPFKYTDKKPPASAFVEMIKKKNLRLRNEEHYNSNGGSPHSDIDGDEGAINSLSYAIRESIYKNGFPGKNLYSKEIPKLVTDVTKSVADFTTGFITSSITDGKGNDLIKKNRKIK